MSNNFKAFTRGVIFFGFIFFYCYWVWLNINDWQALSAIANFGILGVAVLTIYFAYLEYTRQREESRIDRTVEILSRYSSQVCRDVGDLLNATALDPPLTPQMTTTSSEWTLKFDRAFSYMEELGMYIQYGRIDFDLVYEYLSVIVLELFEKYVNYIRHVRRIESTAFENFEKLYLKINTRRLKIQNS